MMRRRRFVFVVMLTVLATPVPRAQAALTNERVRDYVLKAGAKIDSTQGSLLVTSIGSGGSRVEIRVLNDSEKHRVGLYAYGFGNASEAKDVVALLEYLLKANSELGTGSFFVDKDRDIGYKLLLETRDTLTAQTFQIKYLAMVAVIRERRAAILKLAGGGSKQDKPVEEPPDEGGDGVSAEPAEPADQLQPPNRSV